MNPSGARAAEQTMLLPPAREGDAELGRSTLRKAGWRLIPLLSVCYAVAFMDRANVSYAALQMNRDLHFNAGVYGFGAGVFFLSYAACELPSSFLLLRFGARRWIARIMLTWGLLAAAMTLARSPATFYTLRFLLGMAEAGFFPGVIYYLSLWFPHEMRSRAISRFYIAFPLSNVLMGLIAGSLLQLNGRLGMKGWQWLFLVEALPAIVLSVVVLRALPDGPETAAWLEPAERAWLLAKLEEDRVAGGFGPQGSHAGLWAVLTDVKVALLGLFFLCVLGASYAYSFSAPAILVAVTGWSGGRAGFLLAAIAMLGAGAMVVVAQLSDRWGVRRPILMVLALLSGAGYLVGGLGHSAWVVVPALTVATVAFFGMQGPALALITTFLSGPTAAMGIAAVNMFAIVGGFVGPNWMGWEITRTGDYRWGLSLLGLPCLVAAAACFLLGSGRSGNGDGSAPARSLTAAKRVRGKASG
jgi:MFS transporter, ACS family, tartrate transporter